MGWQPGPGHGAGPGPDRDPGAPGRDPRLAVFAGDGTAPGPLPSGALALLLDQLSGRERRAAGATANELSGMLRGFSAVESWAGSGKLGIIREMLRRDGTPTPGAGHGDLPEEWSASLRHDLSLALASSVQSADSTALLAWELGARLPGIGALLDNGTLTVPKARIVADTFRFLSDADAEKAELLILAQLSGKTYMQVLRLAEQAALTVDPAMAERRRLENQRNARVSLFREPAGTAGLSGRDLPPDEALAAMAAVTARAEVYKNSEAFGDVRMDMLRAQAYLDLLNEVSAEERIAAATRDQADKAQAAVNADRATDCGNTPDCDDEPGDGNDPDGDEPGGDEPGGPGAPGRPGSPAGDSGAPEDPLARKRRPADLIVPLTTLLGLSERPGEIQGFGLLDPALARALAAAALADPKAAVCVTVTSPEGYAIGHGCTRPQRQPRKSHGRPATQATLPARLNITVPATALRDLANHNRPIGSWAFTQHASTGPPDTWTLTLPDGRRLTVLIEPVPTFDCDHAHETHRYTPGDKLRHLVQIRDGTCTFPSCNRHARESDFEHALPYDKGGRTCACNAGARSRACHRVKQSEGWHVTQPRPGWHQWETPCGRVYIQEPKRYPA